MSIWYLSAICFVWAYAFRFCDLWIKLMRYWSQLEYAMQA